MSGNRTRTCSRCKVAKPLDAEHFQRDCTNSAGLKTRCKECTAAVRQESRAAVLTLLEAAQEPVPAEPVELSPDFEAWLAAADELAARHPQQFHAFLYSERVRRGLEGPIPLTRGA